MYPILYHIIPEIARNTEKKLPLYEKAVRADFSVCPFAARVSDTAAPKKNFIIFENGIDKREIWCYHNGVTTVLYDIVHFLQKGAAYVFYRPDKQNTHL